MDSTALGDRVGSPCAEIFFFFGSLFFFLPPVVAFLCILRVCWFTRCHDRGFLFEMQFERVVSGFAKCMIVRGWCAYSLLGGP